MATSRVEYSMDSPGRMSIRDERKVMFSSSLTHHNSRYFDRKGRLRLACHHRDGRMVGTCWKIIRGGGCVVGQVINV